MEDLGWFSPYKKGGLGLPCLKDKVDMPSLKVNRSRQKLPETMLVSEICMFLPKFLIPCFNILCICFPFSLQSSVFENLAKGSHTLNRSLLRAYCALGTGMG